MKKSDHNISLIQPKLVENNDRIQAWFTLKNAGYDSEKKQIGGLNLGYNTSEKEEIVKENREKLFSELDLDSEWTAFGEQVHSTKIQVVTVGGTYSSTDGLITRVPGLALAIQVADCAAVLMWDTHNQVIGAFHAGWRGAAGDIIPQGLAKMKEHGAEPELMKAYISPCISQKNFEVGEEVAEQFPEGFVDYTSYQKPHVDLKGFLHYQLAEEEIPSSNIEVASGCTVEDEEKFYSYRREGEQSGRMMALIKISEKD